MPYCPELYVANKLNDLALKFGVSPLVAEFELNYRKKQDLVPSQGEGHCYTLSIGGGDLGTDEERAKLDQMAGLLGMKGNFRVFDEIEDANAAVDNALNLAPRARSR